MLHGFAVLHAAATIRVLLNVLTPLLLQGAIAKETSSSRSVCYNITQRRPILVLLYAAPTIRGLSTLPNVVFAKEPFLCRALLQKRRHHQR